MGDSELIKINAAVHDDLAPMGHIQHGLDQVWALALVLDGLAGGIHLHIRFLMHSSLCKRSGCRILASRDPE